MKRIVFVCLIVLAALTVYADNMAKPMQKGGDMPQPPAPMMHNMMPPMGANAENPAEHKDLTQDQAKAKFAEFMDQYMKGFNIKDINTVYMPCGALHQATVADKAGNKFYLDLASDGFVHGPMLPRQ